MKRPYSRQALVEVFKRVGAVRKGGHWQLASGHNSDFYVDTRLVTTDPFGALQTADGLLGPILHQLGQAVMLDNGPLYVVAGGVGGALALGALLAWAGVQDIPHLRGLLVRDEAKDHGTGRRIEGRLPDAGQRCPAVVIDDVLTTGGSVRRVIEAVQDRLDVVAVALVVDREEDGALTALAERYQVQYLLRRADLEPHALIERSLPFESQANSTPAADQEEAHSGDEEGAETDDRTRGSGPSRPGASRQRSEASQQRPEALQRDPRARRGHPVSGADAGPGVHGEDTGNAAQVSPSPSHDRSSSS